MHDDSNEETRFELATHDMDREPATTAMPSTSFIIHPQSVYITYYYFEEGAN